MKRLLILLMLLASVLAHAQTITVGSKMFTESYVLGEIAKQTLMNAGFSVVHKQGMGATAIVWGAVRSGSVDTYPEYTGTLSSELLKQPDLDLTGIRAALKPMGLGVTDELGFNNTYAIVMKRKRAEALGIRTIGDLAKHPELKAGPSHEFLDRKDGWKPLMAKYGVSIKDVRGIQHTLGYEALNSGDIDLMDCYSTDAEIKKYDLQVIQDDRGFFPAYKAVFVYRLALPPKAQAALKSLAGTIDESQMIAMNAEAGKTKNYAAAAQMYFTRRGSQAKVESTNLASQIAGWTLRHLELVAISLALAILIGLPLGIAASRPGFLGTAILGVVGVIQTIPSLALLALLVPVPHLGATATTAVVALFLYSLLPIVRNTATGIATIPLPLRESAIALGLTKRDQLLHVELPLAAPTILAGVKTSAVINIGTATIAALIGAGGLGEPIISGLNIADNATILSGAIPAAILAILAQVLFEQLERAVVPRGLRLGRDRSVQ